MSNWSLTVKFALQFYDDLSLVFVLALILREPVSEGVQRIHVWRLGEFRLVHYGVLRGKNTLANIFGVILNSNQRIFSDKIHIFGFLALIIFLDSLL